MVDELIFTKKHKGHREHLEKIYKLLKDKITPLEFMEYADCKTRDKPKDVEIVSMEDLKSSQRSYTHEKDHIDVWTKYGVSTIISRHKTYDVYGVAPIDFASIFRNANKQTIIEIYKRVLIAPYEEGDKGGTGTDLALYQAFCGKIDLTTTLTQATKLIHKDYEVDESFLIETLA